MFLTIITFILVLSVLVFVHELGHFWMARRFGVKAEEFGFGFPPRLWGIYRIKRPEVIGAHANNKKGKGKWKYVVGSKEVKDCLGTVYSINWIPLGGFVKIKGEDGQNPDEKDSFASRPIWQRAIMLSAGVSMNVILAAILISFGLMFGMPQALDNLGPKARVSNEQIQVVQVLLETPAAKAQVKMGDFILSINKEKFTSYEKLQSFVIEHTGEELEYRIKRGQKVLTMKITPEIIKETGKGGIGIAVAEIGLVRYPVMIAIWEGTKTTGLLIWIIIIAFYELLKGIFIGQGINVNLAGPVGIAAITGQVARMGFIYILQFTALLSINLAIINFFPFPALDGGRVLFLIVEKIKGSPVKREVEAVIHNIGFALLMILVLLVTFRDFAKLGDKFRMLFEKIIG